MEVLKSEDCSWRHFVATLGVWGVALSCWNCPNSSECTMDINGFKPVTCWVHGFMRLSPYQYMSIHPIQLETRLVRPGNLFPVINSSMAALAGPGEWSVCRTVNNGTRVGHRYRKPISMMVRSTVRTLTFLNALALKSAAI
ncbi:hypothetical protein AVEN_23280-1 [Araneus ventricosus]|uniref:Uncharacterized protein n=1 Tax=Araneus ventricosus TaxID=182803 RepID=A0A4Y2VTS1_ARAVE|nr:hypothetical protein AVEN_23280-1 [Araneus ventricosus]